MNLDLVKPIGSIFQAGETLQPRVKRPRQQKLIVSYAKNCPLAYENIYYIMKIANFLVFLIILLYINWSIQLVLL